MDYTLQIHFFRFENIQNRFWAFMQMQFAHAALRQVTGLVFYKLMGTGGGDGFKWYPDFSTYSLLIQFENNESAISFKKSGILKSYLNRTDEHAVIYLQAYESHGYWSGKQPFVIHSFQPEKPVAVITRARIKWKHLYAFWSDVPAASKSLQSFESRLMGKGIGEFPIIQQATFSIWKNQQLMMDFAYRNPNHIRVVRRTRELGWYSEELFARFHPVGMEGTWLGQQWKF